MATALKTPAQHLETYEGVVIFQPRKGQNRDSLYKEICRIYDEHPKIEQDEKGNVYLMPPSGVESGYQDSEACAQLRNWAWRKKHGKTFSSSAIFVFPNGAKRSPDAAWASNERVYAVPYERRRQFAPIVPEFVIEVKSPSDSYKELQRKMAWYIQNGVDLGWLIHPDKREVMIYTKAETSTQTNIDKLRGTGPVKGFTLDLRPIWKGLR